MSTYVSSWSIDFKMTCSPQPKGRGINRELVDQKSLHIPPKGLSIGFSEYENSIISKMKNNISPGLIKQIEKKHDIKLSSYWLNLFLDMDKDQLGVVKASGKLLEGDSLDMIVADYQTLDTDLGLTIPLVIGGGPQYDQLPAYKKSGKVNNIRITGPELLAQMKEAAEQNLENVVQALTQKGVGAIALPWNTLKVTPHGNEGGKKIDVGYVGDVNYVDTAHIKKAIFEGKIPVISHLGVDDDGQVYNVNATPAAASIVKQLQAYKLILLGNKPILYQESMPAIPSNIVSEIKSESALNKLEKQGIISKGMSLNAREAYKLLKGMGPGRSVQITTPANLVAELLTDGKGTMLRMPFILQSYFQPEHLGEDGKERLTEMINDAFKVREKTLSQDYWINSHMQAYPISKIYTDVEKTGGAIVRNLEDNSYICKLFTHPDYRGNGLATQLMERINSDQGSFLWRTKCSEENQATIGFYMNLVKKFKDNGIQRPDKYTGQEKVGDYLIFAVNMEPKEFSQIKDKAAKLPATMN